MRAEGYEFIPTMMHLLKRYCEDIPEDNRTGVDLKLAQALDSIPEAKELVKTVVKIHEEIPYEKKRRAFSPKYLNLKLEEGIDPNQMSEILQKSTTFKIKL